MSALDIFPLSHLGRFFLLEPENESVLDSTLFIGGLLIGTYLFSSRLRLIAEERVEEKG